MPFIEIERKTDILALAAFLLALGGIIYQVYGFLKGPRVTLFPPEQVVIKSHTYPAGKYVRFGGRMSYVNTGQLGYNAMVRRETLSFRLDGRDYQQEWQEFRSFSLEDDGSVKSDKASDAHPMSINAGSPESHDTFFAPRSIRCKNGASDCKPYRNFLTWTKFLEKLSGQKKLTFEFTAEFFSEPTQKVTCTVDVTEDLVKHLRGRKEINAPPCWQIGQ